MVFGAESDSYADADADPKSIFTHPWTCVCQLVYPQDNLVDLVDLLVQKYVQIFLLINFSSKSLTDFGRRAKSPLFTEIYETGKKLAMKCSTLMH